MLVKGEVYSALNNSAINEKYYKRVQNLLIKLKSRMWVSKSKCHIWYITDTPANKSEKWYRNYSIKIWTWSF